MKSKKPGLLDLVKSCTRLLDDKKAADLRVLDVSGQSSITDYLIVATATSEPHLRALRIEIEKILDASKSTIVGIETAHESGWTVVDAFDVMIHLFLAPARAHYGLENLWKDATDLSIPKLLGVAPVPAVKSLVKPVAKPKSRPAAKPVAKPAKSKLAATPVKGKAKAKK